MWDWLRKAAQGVGNFIYNSTPVGGAIKSVQRNPQLQQQARSIQRGVQQVQRQIPQPPPVPKINLPKINLSQAGQILSSLNPGYQAGKFIQQQVKKPVFQDFTKGAGIGIKFATNQKLNPNEQRLVDIAGRNQVFKPVVDFTKWNNQVKDQQRQKMDQEIALYRKSPATAMARTLFGPFSSLAQAHQSANRVGVNIPKFDTTKAVEDTSQALAKTPLRKVWGMGTAGDVIKPIFAQGGRVLDVAQTQENYSEGMKGISELGSDAATLGSLFYTGGLSSQIGRAPARAVPGLVLKYAPRMAASGAGQNILTQLASGKKLNELDLGEAAISGGAYAGLGSLAPLAGKAIGKGLSKLATPAQASSGKIAKSLDDPITVKTLAEKGKLLQDGYTNVKVKFSAPTHAVDIKNNGAVTELAPKGIKGVKLDKSTQEAVNAGALSPQLAQQGYKVTPDLEIISPTGKKLSIGEVQQLEQNKALTKAEQKIAQGQETYAQAEDLTKQLGKQPARVADDFNQPRSPNGRYGNKEFNPELEQLKAYQTEQLQVLQRANQNSPEFRGAMDNYNSAQKRIDALEQPKVVADTSTTINETVPKGTFDESGVRESGLAKQLEAKGYKQEVYSDIPGYKKLPNETLLDDANARIAKNEREVIDSVVNRDRSIPVTPQQQADAIALLNKLALEDRTEEMARIAKATAINSREAGRAVQIVSRLQAQTPEGAMIRAQKIITEYNEKFAKENKHINLTTDQENTIVAMAKKIQQFGEGTRERDVASAELLKFIEELVPPSALKKISSAQTMAQLLNPKTAIRNIIGNLGMAGFEDLSTVPAAIADRVISKLAGTQRTTAIASPIARTKGAIKGVKYGIEDAGKGIKTSGLSGQFDIQPDVFKKGIMKKLQTALGYELGAADKAFYTSQFDSTLNSMMRAQKVKVPTRDMAEIANAEALYATFQNNSKLADALTTVKGKMNLGKEWGIGDLVLKYPKTPGNIVSVGMDYSPIGFAKGLYSLAKNWSNLSPSLQREAVRNIGRGLTGSGLIMGGYVLAQNGIISGKKNSDKDIAALDRQQGEGPFSFNFSALQRFLKGEDTKVREGDVIANYDWMQPNAIQLSMGANMVINAGKGVDVQLGDMSQALGDATNTVIEQPVLKGVGDFISTATNTERGGGVGKAIENVFSGAPASFTPSIVNQIGQMMDNTARSRYAPNFQGEVINSVKARLPFLRNSLQPQVDTFGNAKEQYQNGGNNWMNVFLNPAFVRTFKTNPAYDLVRGIFERTGEDKQAPRLADYKVKVNGQDKQLTPEEYKNYQTYLGQKTAKVYDQMAKDPAFSRLSDVEKANRMSSALSDINAAALIELFGNTPENRPDRGVRNILSSGDAKYSNSLSGKYEALTPRQKYEEALANYNQDKGDGLVSEIGDVKAQKELRRLGVQAGFNNDTVDLYGLANKEIDAYLSSKQNTGKIWNDLLKLDDAMVAAGYTSKLRDKYGNLKNLAGTGKGKGKGGRRKVAGLTKAPKLRSIKLSAGKVPKISRTAKVKFRRYA